MRMTNQNCSLSAARLCWVLSPNKIDSSRPADQNYRGVDAGKQQHAALFGSFTEQVSYAQMHAIKHAWLH